MPTPPPLNAPQLSGGSAVKTIEPAKASTPSKKVFAGWPAPVEKPNVSSNVLKPSLLASRD
jgi:hypothetical protein